MPKSKKPSNTKRPAKMNPLAKYILLESEREGAGPDAQTREQLELLTGGKPGKTAKSGKAAPKAAKRIARK
jgi:hypothetical protein